MFNINLCGIAAHNKQLLEKAEKQLTQSQAKIMQAFNLALPNY